VVTSDSLTLQESIAVSGDRQSATELSHRARTERPQPSVSPEELFRRYELVHQEQQRQQHQQVIQESRTHNVYRNDNVDFTIGM